MPASLLTAKIRGVRSYSPWEADTQTIEFMPLTLIVGANGTGKTTVIEALKFIVSGEEPPLSDSRRNFIHTPKNNTRITGKDTSYAAIEIQFRNSKGDLCIAKREISHATGARVTPSIASSYKIGRSSWVNVHRQEDWNKVLPHLFGLPNQAILNNVILCHQEDNLWCMADSSSVKQIFDKIFGCESYKKELRFIDLEIKNSKSTLQIAERDLLHVRQNLDRKKTLLNQIKDLEQDLEEAKAKVEKLSVEIAHQTERRNVITDALQKVESQSRKIESLQQRLKELSERDGILRRSLQPITKRSHVQDAPARKKPAQDPTAVDLGNVIENLEKMTVISKQLSPSETVDALLALLKESLDKIEEIRSRFVIHIEETRVNESDAAERENAYRDTIESNIRDNLEQLGSVKEDIEKIQQQVRETDQLENCREELKEVEETRSKLCDKRSMINGSKIQMERELARLKAELNSYKLCNTQYALDLGTVVCNKTIISDLEKLKECFQQSIMTFHDQMIIKINEVLRARWKQIYQGVDIDYIELVDEEITRGKDKKSFNYHIAMRKSGIQMKMREKSSAGQRALASIILRMTLAELFVKDFAFIALDEPTANLDLANVQALAKSIGLYVRKRTKNCANIQWIIITHDEQFLRALDEECSPYFYRLQINQSGYSEIKKVSSSDIEA